MHASLAHICVLGEPSRGSLVVDRTGSVHLSCPASVGFVASVRYIRLCELRTTTTRTLMVSTVESTTKILQRCVFRNIWDLKCEKTFPQWDMELERIARQAFGKDFLFSECPTTEELANAGFGAPRTRGGLAQGLSAETQRITGVWIEKNELLYDVVLDSLKLNTVDIDHVRRIFGPSRDGNGLARWARGKADVSAKSTQMRIKARIDSLQVATHMVADEVDDIFQVIEIDWCKVSGRDHSVSAMIDKSIELIPEGHPLYSIARNLYTLVMVSGGDVSSGYDDYGAFRRQWVEYCRQEDFRLGRVKQSAGAAFVGAPTDSRMRGGSDNKSDKFTKWKSCCPNCPMFGCESKGDKADCDIFGTKPLDQLKGTANQQRLSAILRAFVKQSGAKSITAKDMQNKDSAVRRFIREFRSKESQAKKEGGGMLLSEVAPDDDDFWNQLLTNETVLVLSSLAPVSSGQPDEVAASIGAADFGAAFGELDTPAAAPIVNAEVSPPPPSPMLPPIKATIPVITISTQEPQYLAPPPPSARFSPIQMASLPEGDNVQRPLISPAA